MSRRKINAARKNIVLAAAKTGGQTTAPKLSGTISPKSISRTRQDILSWNMALNQARTAENPKFYALQLLYNEIVNDALLSSQLENRRLKSLSTPFIFNDLKGTLIEDLTALLQNQTWIADLNRHIVNSRFYGHSLIEFTYVNGMLKTNLIPRTNVDPVNGRVYPDYADDKFVEYRKMAEYGSWIIEFGDSTNLGLLNTCVPHVLMKRFAQSCWSELCEIYGIPPRVMKTNTHDTNMLRRGEKMMKDMGAASWFIIDSSEDFQFAQGVSTNGDVYKNLIGLCNNEMSLTVSGVVIGQDTVNGNRSKEQASQSMLQDLVDSDLTLLEQYWNSTVIPSLVQIYTEIKGDVVYGYPKAEDLDKLWKMVKEAWTQYDVPAEWVTDTFGIPVEPKKQVPANTGLNFGADFFV
ncbi:phage portal protein family protein [Flavobacterium cerinum]|uniref:DUF935 family protein n=1 Tax=Flavobacterium cerinum TaxID=2502784 RepID=A0A3S3QLI7_9FLAO|nr:DUF935 family protein [Flavobacterium cerinum]RWX00927.1 DUF935 family protein [Flavobacterium cerinum]